MEFPYAEMHAFPDGDAPHSGNPAGVVMLHRDLPDADLLGVAQSNNLSETAYLKPMGEKDQWGLRWFAPGLEVELCGHATLASAAWLFETGRVVGAEARFHTLSGLLKVSRLDDDRYQMDFPVIGFEPARLTRPSPQRWAPARRTRSMRSSAFTAIAIKCWCLPMRAKWWGLSRTSRHWRPRAPM